MKTLEQYEKEKAQLHEKMRNAMEPHPNGIACPECGSELWDRNPSIMLTSMPPKYDIHCPKCNYRGYRTI